MAKKRKRVDDESKRGSTQVVCPCGRTVARFHRQTKGDALPWKLNPGMELQQRFQEAPRVRCTCGKVHVLLRANQ